MAEELKQLVGQVLEKQGVLAKLRAELRASVFIAVDQHDKQQPAAARSRSRSKELDDLLKTPSGALLAGLVREFLQWSSLRCTLKVYEPELNDAAAHAERSTLQKQLGIAAGFDGPLLLALLDGAVAGAPLAAAAPGVAAGKPAAPPAAPNGSKQGGAVDKEHSYAGSLAAVGSVASAGVASVAKSVSVEDFDFDSGAEHTSLDGSDEYAALTMGRKSSATEASLPPISEGEPRAGEPQPLAPELSKQKSSKNALGMSGSGGESDDDAFEESDFSDGPELAGLSSGDIKPAPAAAAARSGSGEAKALPAAAALSTSGDIKPPQGRSAGDASAAGKGVAVQPPAAAAPKAEAKPADAKPASAAAPKADAKPAATEKPAEAKPSATAADGKPAAATAATAAAHRTSGGGALDDLKSGSATGSAGGSGVTSPTSSLPNSPRNAKLAPLAPLPSAAAGKLAPLSPLGSGGSSPLAKPSAGGLSPTPAPLGAAGPGARRSGDELKEQLRREGLLADAQPRSPAASASLSASLELPPGPLGGAASGSGSAAAGKAAPAGGRAAAAPAAASASAASGAAAKGDVKAGGAAAAPPSKPTGGVYDLEVSLASGSLELGEQLGQLAAHTQLDLPEDLSEIEIEDLSDDGIGGPVTTTPWPGAISMDMRDTGLSASDLSGDIEHAVSRADLVESAEAAAPAGRRRFSGSS